VTPVYTIEKEAGPDHDKTFYVSVALQGEVLAHGSGKNKKEAQQDAAQRPSNGSCRCSTNFPRAVRQHEAADHLSIFLPHSGCPFNAFIATNMP
jgi:hypothetical protein